MDKFVELADNKVMILYAINKLEQRASDNIISDIFLNLKLMNYFDLLENLHDLVSRDYILQKISDNKKIYRITEKGKKTLESFDSRISKGIKKRINEKSARVLDGSEHENYVIADFREIDVDVYEIELIIKERSVDLFNLQLLVGNKAEAIRICEVFEKDHQDLYTYIIKYFNNNYEKSPTS